MNGFGFISNPSVSLTTTCVRSVQVHLIETRDYWVRCETELEVEGLPLVVGLRGIDSLQ